jgi:hypothetical protein
VRHLRTDLPAMNHDPRSTLNLKDEMQPLSQVRSRIARRGPLVTGRKPLRCDRTPTCNGSVEPLLADSSRARGHPATSKETTHYPIEFMGRRRPRQAMLARFELMPL